MQICRYNILYSIKIRIKAKNLVIESYKVLTESYKVIEYEQKMQKDQGEEMMKEKQKD